MGESPPEMYKITIKEVKKLVKDHPEYAIFLSKLREEQKKVKDDWKHRGISTSYEHMF